MARRLDSKCKGGRWDRQAVSGAAESGPGTYECFQAQTSIVAAGHSKPPSPKGQGSEGYGDHPHLGQIIVDIDRGPKGDVSS